MPPARRILLMYVTVSSGHHHASRAIAQAIHEHDPTAQLTSVDVFDYTSRFVRWAIMRSYLSIIRHQPNVWEYLYDNPAIHQRVRHLRQLLHRYHAGKLRRLFEQSRPQVVVCTQAFPCGIVADFKKHAGLTVPLVGVLTDFAPHLYWLHELVDAYVVPSEEVKQRFVSYGIEDRRIHVLGIPIDPRFAQPTNAAHVLREFQLDERLPLILIMGGGGGFGPLREIIQSLDALPEPCQFVVLAGTNRPLLTWIQRQRFRHRVLANGYVDSVHRLMGAATLLITKPGGLTTSEALATHTPLVIVCPIPGQEACNAQFLLSKGAAIQVEASERMRDVVQNLLKNPDRLAALRENAKALAHPFAASEIAELVLGLADRLQRHEPASRAV